MAATVGILRCLSSRPSPAVSTHASSNPSSLRRAAGNINMLSCPDRMVKMFTTKVQMQIQPLSSNHKGFPSMLSGAFEELQIHPFSRLSEIGKQLSDFCCKNSEHSNDHEIRSLFILLRTLLVSSTSMMIMPYRALAETCESKNSLFNMPILFAISFIGATVGGLLARQRRGELKKLNEQLRQINAALRRQAKMESYAPNLSYAPVSRVAESEIIVDPRRAELINYLRTGKNYLRNQEPDRAFAEFEKAFELAECMEDYIEQKKAARGLGASLQRQGKHRDAIKYHSKVVEISRRTNEDSGSTEAYGAIADCYTELGDLERAAKFYDKYISRLESD